MKIGVNLWTIYGWEPKTWLSDKILADLAAAGAQGLELILDESHFTSERWLAHRHQLKERFSSLDLAVPSVASSLFWKYNPASHSPVTRSHALRIMRDECQIAREYGAE